MRIKKTLALCSTSMAILAFAASNSWAQAAPDPTPAADSTEVEELVVTGFRASLASAQTLKRNSDNIVDAIVAEDIGKLPDVTVAQSLARITGVQVIRSGGEASQVLVRGLPDITTTYNGRDIFTAEARFVAVQDFPAGGVAALEVYKSTTANLVEGGIAGLVNVRSRRPFDFGDREVAGGLNLTYAKQAQDWNWNGNLLLSDRWQTSIGEIGLLVNVSQHTLRFLDSARFNGGYIEDAAPEQVTNPALVGVRYPDAVGIFYGESERRRPSVNAAIQWRPNDKLELYGDFLYQGYREQVEDRRLFVPLHIDGARFSNVVLKPGTNQVQSMTVGGDVFRPWMFQGATERKTDTYQYAIGGMYSNGPWKISMDLARTISDFEITLYSNDQEISSSPTFNVNFDVPDGDGGVEFDFGNYDFGNPNNYLWRGIFDRYQTASGDDWQWRTDVDYSTGREGITNLQFGVRFVDRNGSYQAGERFGNGGGRPLTSLPLDLEQFEPGFRGSDIQQLRTWISPTYDSIRDNIEALRALSGLPAGRPPIDAFTVFNANEKSYAGYGQLKYAFNSGVPIDGVIGARVVRTELNIEGTVRQFDPFTLTPREVSSEYTDFLPSVTARLHLTDQLQLRLAANRTRTRANFGQLNPSVTIDRFPDGGGVFNGNGGNPDLRPLTSDNYDAILEYYFRPSASATFGVFRRDISGFIENRTEIVTDPVFGQVRLNRPVNLADATLQGFEASFTAFLDFDSVPEWARGFGVQANFTYIDNPDRLNLVSKYSYNVVGIYERGPFSARLAYNFRSDHQQFCETFGFQNSGCEYADSISRLDFSASYTPFENITIAFDASNILGTPFKSYREYNNAGGPTMGTFPRDVRYEESVYSLGIRFRM
jgi:iron complex outermembrane recepter protein